MHNFSTTPVLFSELPAKDGKLGIIILNRPEALNAISMQVVVDLSAKLHAWANDPTVKAVVIRGNGERAFCAGGDLKQLYASGRENFLQAVPFFKHEYLLNKYIHMYPKPYISLIHGITMGGGVGLSIHGSHVVAAPDLRLAMPECGIGLYPDTGASFILGHCPNYTGMYMGLTGNIISAADAIYCGLVNNCVASDKFEAVIDGICNLDLSNDPELNIDQLMSTLKIDLPIGDLEQHMHTVKTCFSLDSVEKILSALQQSSDPWAQQQAQIIQTRSPTSLKVTHQEITLAANMDIAECMRLEFNLTSEILQGHDIYEGIRAAVIDKTRDPKWLPASLNEVSEASIQEMFRIKWTI